MLTKYKNKLILNGDDLPDFQSVQGSSRIKGGWSFPIDYFAVNQIGKILGTKLVPSDDVKKWYYEEHNKNMLAKKIQANQDNSQIQNKGWLNKELKDYQLQGVKFFLAVNRCILGFEAGLGKTLTAINCMKTINAKKVLVVCPSYLKYNWEDEINKWSNYSSTIINGTANQREEGYKEYKKLDNNILIVNYEQIRYKVTKGENNKVTNKEIKIHKDVLEPIWDLIIMDECHRLKGRDSQVSEGMLKLKSKGKLMLTGTPINKCESEIWKLLRVLDKQRFTSYWKFAEYYCNVEDGFYGKEIKGLKKPDEYSKLLNRYMLRKKKEDVIDLPSKIIKTIKVDLSPKQLKIYKQAEKEYLNPKGDVIESDVEKFIRLNQIVQNPAILDGQNVSSLTDTAIEILQDNEGKFIIGCVFIGMSELVYETIKKNFPKRDVYLVNGTINTKDRYETIEKWKKSRDSIIVTTIRAMSEGLNLDICDNMMYLDYDWSNVANSQFSNRIHRMTSTRSKMYYHLIVKNTCSEYKYYKLMNEDHRMSKALNDTPSDIKYLAEEYRRSLND